MKRVLCIAALTVAGIGLSATPAAAASDPLAGPYVTVDADASDGSVGVGTGIPGQPLFGVRVTNGVVCTGFSYQVPFCVGIGVATN